MSTNNDDLAEEVEAEEPLGNPAPPPDVDLEKLRGDRIGDTVFSGKWCIQTVMKLMQSNVVLKPDSGDDDGDEIVDMEEDLQNEVGALWDMTSNVQVCQYLHSVGAVESICHVITNSRCPRATEMCVGMLANIIYHNELWDIMKDDTSFFSILIQLLTSTDQPVLLELNRFFNTALCHHNSDVFYSSLNHSGQLVTQELLRILSGSTNGDLLKQVAELVYSLMYRDEDDTQFSAHFADADFVAAVLEASKEIGWKHESSGQNHIMEVFHCFTTYEAGIVALGASLEEISACDTTYLRVLCQHGLSLASSCPVLTAILSTLHHIMTRSSTVRDSLLASPSFLHCVLITLVAVYRKLGQYHTISGHTSSNGRAGNKQHPLLTSDTNWQSLEDKDEDGAGGRGTPGAADSESHKFQSPSTRGVDQRGSWSERAFAAPTSTGAGALSSETGAFRTPEASPRPQYQKGGRGPTELDVSWSMRRLASPLVPEEEEGEGEGQQWKRPKERGKFKRRGEAGSSGKRKGDKEQTKSKVAEDDDSDEMEEVKGEELKPAQDISPTEGAASSSAGLEPVPMSTEEETAQGLEASNSTLKAMRIQGQNRAGIDSRLSGGFTPSDTEPGGDQDNERSADRLGEGSRDSASAEFGTDAKPVGDNRSLQLESSGQIKDESSGENKETSQQTLGAISHEDADEEMLGGVDAGFDYLDKDNYVEEEEEGGELNKSVSSGGGERYRSLLGIIKELLVDYLNAMAESQEEQDGATPLISATMAYLDRQCSSTELRALARCTQGADGLVVGVSVEDDGGRGGRHPASSPLERLVQLCDRFKARHLRAVLTRCLAAGDS